MFSHQKKKTDFQKSSSKGGGKNPPLLKCAGCLNSGTLQYNPRQRSLLKHTNESSFSVAPGPDRPGALLYNPSSSMRGVPQYAATGVLVDN